MKRDEFEAVMDELEAAQDATMDRAFDASDEQLSYLSGKDVGLARARAILRANVEVEDE